MARFTWFEYLTSEPAKAQTFFKTVFGWDAQTYVLPGGAKYTAIVNAGRPIGSYNAPLKGTPIFRYSEPYSRWVPYLEVQDAHALIGTLKAAGGSVARELSAIHDGRMAVLTDPAGQHFGMWQPAAFDVNRTWGSEPGSFCWLELYTTQPGAAVTLLKHMAGFFEQKSQLPDGSPYVTLEADGVAHAGVRKPMQGSQLGWFAWVRVPDLATALMRALQFETQVIQPPIPGAAPMAIIVDPYGATIGLAQG